MAQTFISNHQHIVFSTKQRAQLIKDREKLWAYTAGICRNIGAAPRAIGGMDDHCHLLLTLRDLQISKIVNAVKSNSSKWMNEHKRGFGWQNGYAAFSVSASNIASVTKYIEGQEEHHRRRTFEEEYIALLKKHDVGYDERYVFD
jgi:REP element-mobilizing transposase RayT